MTYALSDLGRVLSTPIDTYTLRLLGSEDPTHVSSSQLRWVRAVEFLREYLGETGALFLARRVMQDVPVPNVVGMVNRRFVQADQRIYSPDGVPVQPEDPALAQVLESHVLNLAGLEALIERQLERAQHASGAGGAHARSAPARPKSLPSA